MNLLHAGMHSSLWLTWMQVVCLTDAEYSPDDESDLLYTLLYYWQGDPHGEYMH